MTRGEELRVVMVAPSPPPYGGITNWTNLVVEESEKTPKTNIRLVDTSPRKGVSDGRSLWDRVFGGFKSIGVTLSELRGVIDEADVVHVATSGSLACLRDRFVLSFCRKHGVPTVLHLHYGRLPAVCERPTWERALTLGNIERADQVIAIDRPSFDAANGLFPGKCVYIGNPISVKRLDSIQVDKTKTNGTDGTVLYLGWVIPTKGISELVSAWKCVVARYPGWQLKIGGPVSDSCRDELLREGAPSIEFLGELPHDEAMREIQKAELLVLPSYTEGFPNVVLEAMVYGKAIVATSVGAIPEMLADGRGVVVEPRDVDELVQGLCKVIGNRDLRSKLGGQSSPHARSTWDVPVVFGEYRELWGRLVR